MHTIKINRARKIATTGKYPTSFAAMLDCIPSRLIERLTAREIADMIDVLWNASEKAKAIQDAAIVAEGAVWDAKSQRMIELAN